MATLEKIRSKSVLLLFIVGAALLAFIIGDFFTSGRTLFGTGTTIAKVGDQKIDVQEFQRRVQQAQQQMQQSGQRMDNAMLQQQVLDAMIAEKLFAREATELGLTVTDAELSEVMVGKNSAMVDRMIQQQLQLPDAVTAHDMAFNPTKYGMPQEQALQLQQYWLDLENNVEKMLLQQKFNTLFTGVITANELDAKALYDDNAATSHVVYAKKDITSLPDTDFEVGAADIDKIYSAEKNRYALTQPQRLAEYISVNILPSQADILAGQKKVEEAILALNNQPETEGVASMTDFIVERTKISQADVDKQTRLKAALDTLSVGRATLVSKLGNDYTIAKLLNKTNESDKVKLDFMAIQGTRAQVDSLVALLNAGTPFDSIAASPLVAGSQKDSEISLLDPNATMVKELIAGHETGVYFAPDTTAQGGRIVRVAERPAPVTVYEIANVTFTTEPSNATINDLESRLQAYVNSHKTAKEFTDSAQGAGFTVFPAYVDASTPMLGNLNDSHNAVAWVMDASKGEVSPVFGDIQTGRFLAVALQDIYDGYTPARDPQLNAMLTNRARNDKKAAKLLADYNGKAKDVAGYAKLMGVEVDTTTVNFGQYLIPGIGANEADIQGRVASAKAGQLVGPLKGNNSVVVLQVTAIDNEGRPFNYDESAIRFNQQRGAARLGNSLDRILIGNKEIKNNMTTFYK
ncbi:MAG: hypothetical protein HFJ91_05800 [Muribaculaceae bacterium]|nr:hypothetical protein [Muribaculaceae bacterium]